MSDPVHKCVMAGREVGLCWTNESAKRFAYRIGQAGGEPSIRSLRNPRTAASSLFKVAWALLPPAEFSRYETPEDLFVAVDHESEARGIFDAVAGVYQDRFVTDEKKSTSGKSPSPGSSSD